MAGRAPGDESYWRPRFDELKAAVKAGSIGWPVVSDELQHHARGCYSVTAEEDDIRSVLAGDKDLDEVVRAPGQVAALGRDHVDALEHPELGNVLRGQPWDGQARGQTLQLGPDVECLEELTQRRPADLRSAEGQDLHDAERLERAERRVDPGGDPPAPGGRPTRRRRPRPRRRPDGGRHG